MGLFVERSEQNGVITIKYRLAAIFYWLMWPAIALGVLFWIKGDSYLVPTSIVWGLLIILAVPFWGTRREISKAMKEGRLKASGSKYSFRNPLTYQIKASGPPVEESTKSITVVPEDSVDPGGIWSQMSYGRVDTYQKYLDELFNTLDIENLGAGYQWTKEDGDVITDIARRAHKKDGLSFLYIQTLIELYLDADRMVRQLHKDKWVRTVTGTDELPMWDRNFFPDPFPVMKSVKERFFEGDEEA